MDPAETNIYAAILISAIVIGSLLLYFAITVFRNNRRHFKTLSRHFREEMELLEQERTRIARDLHDELGPLLSVTQIHIRTAADEQEGGHMYLEKASKNIQQLTERFGEIARNLTPRTLITKGLETALDDFIGEIAPASRMELRYQYQVKSKLSPGFSLHIYRMVQELLHNAIKHSGSSTVELRLAERKRTIYLFYKDNGHGIEALNGKEFEGIGISSLKKRTEMLGGKIRIGSIKGQGTEYLFELPINTEHEKNDQDHHRR